MKTKSEISMKAPEIPKSSIIDTKYGPVEYVVVGEGKGGLRDRGGGQE